MSVDIEEITSLGTRVLDRILKPVYDRIAEVAKRVETLERHVFDQPKTASDRGKISGTVVIGAGGAGTAGGSSSVLLASASAAEPKPDPESEPDPAVVEEEQPSPMPSPQVAGDLEAGDEPGAA